MASSQTLEACAEHKISVTDKKGERTKRVQRAQWLRAAILGANDGLLSTTSLMLGVGAAKQDQRSMILSGLAGAVAGACSMAVGEFVSVATQRDIERAANVQCASKSMFHGEDDGSDIKLEITVGADPTTIETKLAKTNLATPPVPTPSRIIPCKASCDCEPSPEKASPAMTHAPVLSSARSPMMKVIIRDARKNTTEEAEEEEEDNGEEPLPNPYKAATASAVAFLFGSLVPLISANCVAQNTIRIVVIVVVASIALAIFGGVGAHLGGSPLRVSAMRVLLGGWISMALTYGLLKPLDGDDKKGHDHD